MQRFWKSMYSAILLPLLWLALELMGYLSRKVRRGINGRRGLFASLTGQVERLPPGLRVWFHSSSLGEFEQAKPIIAELKKRVPDLHVIVTFFSPSGFEHSKKYHLAEVNSYIPFDTQKSARRFLDLVRPDAAIMVRYDVWPNHIWELQRRGIPTMIANATMRRQTKRRLPLVRNFHHYVYNAIDEILTVSESDTEAFSFFSLDHPKILTIGDTRYDQVCIRSEEAKRRRIIPRGILAGKKVIVAGSSWAEDEDVLLPAFFELQEKRRDMMLVIVPHEPTVEHIEELERQLADRSTSIRFSALNEFNGEQVIIVDSIGILLILYAYADIAYVGGSFRQGVHNVLEAAVYGVPVLFGPRHRNSHEPLMLVGQGGAFVVNDSRELYRTLDNLLSDDMSRRTAGERAARFVQSNVGATDRFLGHLQPYLESRRKTPNT
jgi:3-deoxy-D-manno-octulosonic-acid transferase